MSTDLALEPPPAAAASRRPLDPWSSERAIRLGFWAAAALAIGQVVTQVVDFQVYGLGIAALDSDTHWSVFGVASLLAQGFVAVAAAARGARTARPGGWLSLSAILALLLAVRVAIPDHPALWAAPLAVVFVMLWSFTALDLARPRRIVRFALLLLTFSFAVHLVGPKIVDALGYGYGSWAYELKGIVKHTTELTGWVLVATGLLAARRYTAPSRARHHRLG